MYIPFSAPPKRQETNPTGSHRFIDIYRRTRRRMARERRRACYSLVSSIKDIVGESFIEDDADDQQKGDRNAMSVSKQKQTKIDTNFGRPTETDSNETHTHTETHKQRYRHRRAHTHTEAQTHTHTKRKTHTRTHTQAQTHTHTKRKTHDRHADRHQDTHSQRSHRCRGHLSNPKGDEVRDLNMLLRNASRSRQL